MCWAIIGGVVSGVGAAMGAMSQKASYEAQAKFEKRQARLEMEAGGYKAARTQEEVERVLGSQRAGFAASGIALSSGSAIDVASDSATEGALDVAAIRWNSKLAADNLRYKSKVSEMNARAAGASAPLAFLAPTLNGIASYSSQFG